jgi:hypothetical protein
MIVLKRPAEHAAEAAKELKALRRQSERLSRTTDHSDYGQPGDDLRCAAAPGFTL